MNSAKYKYTALFELEDELETLNLFEIPSEVVSTVLASAFAKGEKSGIKEQYKATQAIFKQERLKDIYIGECE